MDLDLILITLFVLNGIPAHLPELLHPRQEARPAICQQDPGPVHCLQDGTRDEGQHGRHHCPGSCCCSNRHGTSRQSSHGHIFPVPYGEVTPLLGRGHIDQLLSDYPKPKHIRFDSLSVNICNKWLVGHILPRKYIKR
jgi:hypothetical protein